MRILLTTLNAKYIHINLAIRLLYQLNKEHQGLEWKEFTIKEATEEIAQYCAQFDIVAFSCYIWNITQTLAVAKAIKKINPNTKILLGGPEVSYEWEEVIALEEVDFIIIGEGEVPFGTFIKNYPNLVNVPSLVRKENGEIHYNPQVEAFDLKAYTNIMPYIDDNPADLYNRVLYVETSRGCPYKCEFCLASLDNKVRYLPNEHIKNMLLHLMQHGRTIKFLDRTFNIKKEFTLDIFRFILENYRPNNVFQFEITADIIHPDIIQFIQENVPEGLFRFEIGIQSVNQKTNLEVSRKQNFDKTKKIIKSLDNKIEMHLDLIVGMALDYWDDVKYSFEEVFKLFAPELQLGFLKFLKGTPVREKSDKYEFVYDPNPPYQIIESKYLSKEELYKITQLENALEIYWNKKRSPNTLQYITGQYSSFDFLLELGIYFGSLRDYHQYTLDDVFNILLQFVKDKYPKDKALAQFVALDYYLYHKLRPRPYPWFELDKKEQNNYIEQFRLNKEKGRYVVLDLGFDYEIWKVESKIEPSEMPLILCYSGNKKAEVVGLKMGVE